MTGTDPLRRFPPPRAPEGLRERALLRAREAATAAAPPSRTDRIWYSTRWRLAWLGALAALVLLEAAAVRTGGLDAAPASSTPGMREADAAAIAVGLLPAGYLGDRVVNEMTFLGAGEEAP